MQASFLRFAFAALFSVAVPFGQQTDKPRISNITVLPSEPVQPSGNCKASSSGYLEKNGRTKMTKAELGNFVDSSLRDGYAVTIYPETKRGVFVNLECTNATVSATP
jgi:hypothetical protein